MHLTHLRCDAGAVLTAGIDLAAQPANTGLCVVDWNAGCVVRVAVNDPAAGDGELVEIITMAGMARVGIDAPFGWPDDFVEAVATHHAGGGWPEPPAGDAARRLRLRLRRTDLAVAEATGRWPMSVSADRIAVAAMRCSRLQHLVAGVTGPEGVDRTGTTGLLAETYPAASLGAWGQPATGYKGASPDAIDRRTASLAALIERSGLQAADDAMAAMRASDHLFDAFVCALIARAVVEGATAGPPPDDLGAARQEGWIHVLPADWSPPAGPDAAPVVRRER
jgi:hypothetical protein